jgi:hypothetical protein
MLHFMRKSPAFATRLPFSAARPLWRGRIFHVIDRHILGMSINMHGKLFSDWCCPECGVFLSPRPILQSEAEALLDAHYESERWRQMMVHPRERGVVRLPEDHPKRRASYVRSVTSSIGRARENHRVSAPPRPKANAALIEYQRPVVRITVPSSKAVAVSPPLRKPESLGQGRCEICNLVVGSGYLPDHLKQYCPGHPPKTVMRLPFRLLPPGEWGIDQILDYYRTEAHHWLAGRSVDEERLRRIDRLDPSGRSVGTTGPLGYALFEFRWTSAVVLECPVEGNATYILWDDWRGMLQLTKGELRQKPNCERIIHRDRSYGKVIQALNRHKPGSSRLSRL